MSITPITGNRNTPVFGAGEYGMFITLQYFKSYHPWRLIESALRSRAQVESVWRVAASPRVRLINSEELHLLSDIQNICSDIQSCYPWTQWDNRDQWTRVRVWNFFAGKINDDLRSAYRQKTMGSDFDHRNVSADGSFARGNSRCRDILQSRKIRLLGKFISLLRTKKKYEHLHS